MATNNQIRANRENAKNSSGPRTAAGKTRSSKNALKHGLLSQDAVLPGEDPADFDRQLSALEDWVSPRNPLEREICRQITDASWRMQRLSRIETAIITANINHARRHNRQFDPDVELDRQGHTKLLGEAMIGHTNSVVQLSRYDGHLTRRFYRAVQLLTDIRQGDQKSREAREARNKGDYGFDVYDPAAPPELQHRYVPANPDVINRAAPDRAAPDRAVQEHAVPNRAFQERVVPNRAARVSKRYPTPPQDHQEGSGPETSQDSTPTSHRVRTSHPVPTTTPVTTPAKPPPPLS